jgi:hypothetical protein
LIFLVALLVLSLWSGFLLREGHKEAAVMPPPIVLFVAAGSCNLEARPYADASLHLLHATYVWHPRSRLHLLVLLEIVGRIVLAPLFQT